MEHTDSRYLVLSQRIATAANNATQVGQALQVVLDEICDLTGWPVGHAYLPKDTHREE